MFPVLDTNLCGVHNINILKNFKQTFLFTYLKMLGRFDILKPIKYALEGGFEIKSNL